jgi:hypothetical protein
MLLPASSSILLLLQIFADRGDSPAVEQVARPAMSAVPPTESAGGFGCGYAALCERE